MLALIAQSVHADPLSGMCLVGGDSRIIEAVFVSLRELILLLCCLVPLFFGCLALIGGCFLILSLQSKSQIMLFLELFRSRYLNEGLYGHLIRLFFCMIHKQHTLLK